MLDSLVRFCLDNGVIVLVILAVIVLAGVAFMPFRTPIDDAPFRDPVPVDAIPDISENQVIVSADWPGRSPRDVEDQVTYPLSTNLQGIPGVQEVRAISGFGMSRIYVVFEDGIDFYWARSRVLEKLVTAGDALPADVIPALGPDATALGQIFWYTVDGPNMSLARLRSIQDFQIKYALQSLEGVAEVASIGGHVREFQINVDPERLRAHGISVLQVAGALKKSNLDIGARTHESQDGQMEFLVRGVGFVADLEDIENTVITTVGHVPITVRQVAQVTMGPAFRRGALADDQGERVGGVVVMRFGANPARVIDRVKEEIERLNLSLATQNVRITPFYDRTQLVDETLDTLTTALWQQVVVTVVVVLLFLLHVRASLVISLTLPLAVLFSFTMMRAFGVDSNLMSLAGIAIAIGTMVDMAIVMGENAYNHLLEKRADVSVTDAVGRSANEVSGALLTAVSTTVISFLPIFLLSGEEGKLFKPLAWTKTFCLVGAALLALVAVPSFCKWFLAPGKAMALRKRPAVAGGLLLASILTGVVIGVLTHPAAGKSGVHGAVWGLVGFVVIGLFLWRAMKETLTPLEKSGFLQSADSRTGKAPNIEIDEFIEFPPGREVPRSEGGIRVEGDDTLPIFDDPIRNDHRFTLADGPHLLDVGESILGVLGEIVDQVPRAQADQQGDEHLPGSRVDIDRRTRVFDHVAGAELIPTGNGQDLLGPRYIPVSHHVGIGTHGLFVDPGMEGDEWLDRVCIGGSDDGLQSGKSPVSSQGAPGDDLGSQGIPGRSSKVGPEIIEDVHHAPISCMARITTGRGITDRPLVDVEHP